MIKDAIAHLVERKDLSQKESYAAMKEIMEGQATPSLIAGFLVALRIKGETVDEIAGCALAMRDASRPLNIGSPLIVDNCGTGGDGRHSLNISTAASFVVAGAGFTVAKHGNRAISSKCGSADVLEALGVKVDCPLAMVEQAINENGVGFMFAPAFHPAMRFAMPTRKELGLRTVFNLLGPLTNPARARVQLIGVYEPTLTRVVAAVMRKMGHIAGLVVHSHGWDEITLEGPTHVSELIRNKVRNYQLTHKDFGLPKIATRHLAGGDAAQNADLILKIFQGEKFPARHVVVANAAALIWLAERATKNPQMKLKEAVKKAEDSIDSGAALKKLNGLAETSQIIE
ncbi:MAG: Anthranilate phosphoribosyltransferase [Elusimicrobia bacterium]|nr:Anthranilate phosphoribosyltransferase [Elusimicrobiota bacterium]